MPLDGLGAVTAQAGALASSSELDRAMSAAAKVKAGANGKAGATEKARELDDAAKRFEELLSTMLVRELRRGVEQGFFGEGAGADVFEGWLDEHLGRSLAREGVFDLAQAVRISLGANQAAADAEKTGKESAQ